MTDPLKDLSKAAVSVWLDDLSRPLLTTGALSRLVRERHVVVNTMPQATLAAVADHGTIHGDTIRPCYPEASRFSFAPSRPIASAPPCRATRPKTRREAMPTTQKAAPATLARATTFSSSCRTRVSTPQATPKGDAAPR